MQLNKFMAEKGFTPESSGGGCMWYLKAIKGGLHVAITDASGGHLPETMEEPICAGLFDSELVELSCTKYTNINGFFDRSKF
jgi:hypothetical protein